MSLTERLAKNDVALAYSPQLSELCDSVETLQKRTSTAFSLIQAYGLFEHVKVFKPTSASKEQLVYFHSNDYVEFLRCSSEPNRNLELLEREGELEHGFGVGYDCPLFASLYGYGTLVAGASIQCADLLNKGEAKVAINICGGWHHARRSQAAGFCYFNDCVLSILKLRKRYKRILYVDLDVHHGDGVEEAFLASANVMTVSLHLQEPGFYPCSGDLTDLGVGRGKNYAVNVPLRRGLNDEQFIEIFGNILPRLKINFDPHAVVVQLGVDGLTGDPNQAFNLTPTSYCVSLQGILALNLPCLLLGGGGYRPVNFAKCWAQLLSTVVSRPLLEDIPEHPFFPLYGPDFVLTIQEGSLPNANSAEYLRSVLDAIASRFPEPLGIYPSNY